MQAVGENNFQTRKQNYIRHEWSLVTLKTLRNFAEYCVEELKKLPLRKAKEAQVTVNKEKGREIQHFVQ